MVVAATLTVVSVLDRNARRKLDLERSDAVSDADRVDAANVAERVVVQRRRHRQRTDRARVSPSASSQARRKWRTVDLWIQRSLEGMSE